MRTQSRSNLQVYCCQPSPSLLLKFWWGVLKDSKPTKQKTRSVFKEGSLRGEMAQRTRTTRPSHTALNVVCCSRERPFLVLDQDLSKSGAVETGCSDLWCYILVYYVIPPQSTAPPSHCTPLKWIPTGLDGKGSPIRSCQPSSFRRHRYYLLFGARPYVVCSRKQHY